MAHYSSDALWLGHCQACPVWHILESWLLAPELLFQQADQEQGQENIYGLLGASVGKTHKDSTGFEGPHSLGPRGASQVGGSPSTSRRGCQQLQLDSGTLRPRRELGRPDGETAEQREAGGKPPPSSFH